MTIKLNTIKDVYDFVQIVNSLPFELVGTQGRYTINCGSILGLFSLDLLKPFEIHTDGEYGSTDILFKNTFGDYEVHKDGR